MALRVACIGGGPGGLFFSTLFKQTVPDAEVVLFERNQATDAFGFGVVFSDATLNRINDADPVVRDGLRDHGTHWDDIEVWLKGEQKAFTGNGMAAIYRKTLLQLMQERAAEAGVEMRFGQYVPDLSQLKDFDLIVGADGANSSTREQLGESLGHTAETASAKFIWFGTSHIFKGMTFIHRKSEFGNFAVHGYPISDNLSTFIVETDEETWRKAGLDEFDVSQPPGPSDLKTQRFLEKLFAEDINGEPLVANSSRWANFRTRRTRTWHKGKVVLLGDAVHTAHFSVGSGTKMAMEDAITLVREVAAHQDDLEQAFTNYEAERQPQVAKIQNQARGGLSWWEHFGRYYDAFDPTQFTFHFFSRSIDIDKIRLRDPELVASTEQDWLDRHGNAPLGTPLTAGTAEFSGRVLAISPEGAGASLTGAGGSLALVTDPAEANISNGLLLTAPDTEAGLAAAFAQLPAEAGAVVIRGGNAFTRILLSEEARLGRGLTSVIVDDRGPASNLTLVLSGRADAVVPASVEVSNA
ncbi:2-polyprenyl-6-methoxyphenol hydroxylase [Pseudarthrobacter phenanthrenivorans]|uniref:2-polyprenyl-6-methoxyphenol hydroxylase n=2 Tax=Pseudarthrobacter phenanthrenivorans TaxID=361575 RepID=A0A3B0FPR8_PSEPS|nr:FAD-dependent monooxygenase [Pseudarthrobacter phenanthrenivorans]ADX75075.1 2-polyprenyl-6-methoxyphenol hydroxylase-like oxidoreductase [Pseudarthrobacter phenanthrenivorans Sphe3]RKO21865.1 2-polyprenyl-6-methoxyphenol hydroxylase [Pseudarthrobacter phenanthrenivorans]